MNSPVNILLVDDEPRNLEVLESILECPEYRLVRALNAEQALHRLISQDYAVIVLDVRMPDMNGLELAALIKQRKKTQHIPIIFLTAYYQEDEHVMQGYGAGAVDYLSKPVSPAILRSKVAVFVDLFRKSRALEAEVAERSQAERKVRELNEALAARIDDLAAANSELESFSYSVSHDLRAPLRQAAGFVSLLRKTAGDSVEPAAREYLDLIQDSVTRMGQLIDDLLAFSRVGRAELRLSNVSLQQIVEQARHGLQPGTDGRLVDFEVGPLPEVQADPAMLLQVVTNLLDNAFKFTRPRERARIEIGAEEINGELVVHVRDNGVGFDPRYADKLFGVFQRLHAASEFEGTGIGLASVRRIIHRFGGRTWAEATPGGGATVYFTLPRAAESGVSEKGAGTK